MCNSRSGAKIFISLSLSTGKFHYSGCFKKITPAKALKKATAMAVAERFIELINISGDDIKKYAEIK